NHFNPMYVYRATWAPHRCRLPDRCKTPARLLVSRRKADGRLIMLKSVREESFVVFGLGTFGSNCARTLYRSGAIVLAVDQEEKIVDQVSQQVTVAVRADVL